jgi:hypothetical protein
VYARVGVQSLRWRSDGGGGGTQWILGAKTNYHDIKHNIHMTNKLQTSLMDASIRKKEK